MRPLPAHMLDERIKRVWRINSLILTAIMSVVLFGVFIPLWLLVHISILWGLIPAVILVLRLVLNFGVYPVIRYARWRYEVKDDEVEIRKGLFFISHAIVPIVRVQFTDTSQGPIMRMFGLAEVTITTAGGAQGIPGLRLEDADALRDRVAEIAKHLQESV
jgi:membrane protein YdbS with pleckstrin-like domain